MINRLIILFFISAGLTGYSCSNGSDKEKNIDSPVSGEILIVVDEAYEPLIKAQLETFHSLYEYADIHVRYLPEAEVFQEFMNNDSVRLAITARSLTKPEEEYFVNLKIIPRETKVAVDAITFVLNKNNQDSLLTYEQLKMILQGRIRAWKDLNNKVGGDSIQVVFDKNGSSTTRYLKENFYPRNIFLQTGFLFNRIAK